MILSHDVWHALEADDAALAAEVPKLLERAQHIARRMALLEEAGQNCIRLLSSDVDTTEVLHDMRTWKAQWDSLQEEAKTS